MLFPLIPFIFGILFPETLTYTNVIKPLAQILSLLPQLYESFCNKSTNGVSMLSQHLNLIGGFLGIFMCFIIPPATTTTYIIYINSIIQAFSIYLLAVFFGEIVFLKKEKKSNSDKIIIFD